eukprot:7377109-Prymnesium_polylepis.1
MQRQHKVTLVESLADIARLDLFDDTEHDRFEWRQEHGHPELRRAVCFDAIHFDHVVCDTHGASCMHCTAQRARRKLATSAPRCGCAVPDCDADLEPALHDRWDEYLTPDIKSLHDAHGLQRLAALVGEDAGLAAWATAGTAQVCPACFGLVERNEGCAHMTCACGAEFCFLCGGQWPCKQKRCGMGGGADTGLLRDALQTRKRKLAAARTLMMAAGAAHGAARAAAPAESLICKLPREVLEAIARKVIDAV